MSGRFKWLAVIGTVVVIVAGIGLTAVFAADPPTGTSTTGQGQKYGQVFVDKLAGLLGIDTTKLTDSIKQAEKDTIDQAQKDGALTQQQGDAAKQHIDKAEANGIVPFGFRMGPMMGKMGGLEDAPKMAMVDYMKTYMQAIADKLGLSLTDLQAQMKAGKSISDLATEKNVAENDVKDAGVAAVKTQLDQAVKDGKLTQTQADNIIERLKNASTFTGPMKGQRHEGAKVQNQSSQKQS